MNIKDEIDKANKVYFAGPTKDYSIAELANEIIRTAEFYDLTHEYVFSCLTIAKAIGRVEMASEAMEKGSDN